MSRGKKRAQAEAMSEVLQNAGSSPTGKLILAVAQVSEAFERQDKLSANDVILMLREAIGKTSKRKSDDTKAMVFPDYVVCKCCGGRFKVLHRHLLTTHGLTKIEYIKLHNLPYDYTFVAPNYSATRRSLMARQMLDGSINQRRTPDI